MSLLILFAGGGIGAVDTTITDEGGIGTLRNRGYPPMRSGIGGTLRELNPTTMRSLEVGGGTLREPESTPMRSL